MFYIKYKYNLLYYVYSFKNNYNLYTIKYYL